MPNFFGSRQCCCGPTVERCAIASPTYHFPAPTAADFQTPVVFSILKDAYSFGTQGFPDISVSVEDSAEGIKVNWEMSGDVSWNNRSYIHTFVVLMLNDTYTVPDDGFYIGSAQWCVEARRDAYTGFLPGFSVYGAMRASGGLAPGKLFITQGLGEAEGVDFAHCPNVYGSPVAINSSFVPCSYTRSFFSNYEGYAFRRFTSETDQTIELLSDFSNYITEFDEVFMRSLHQAESWIGHIEDDDGSVETGLVLTFSREAFGDATAVLELRNFQSKYNLTATS